ncbi:hypothetical protein [Archangium sp.]|uniref:hypothetical protein n=1 Tax=Archangium sp. TaxID=1872627 RepID=UPI002D4A64DF|nr:hypothetical protein [Archangium sp.]HYO51685.1 hypothetical protein [Archangium sp.]
MPAARKRATRAIIISDLHLGGSPPYMMSRPERLAAFLESLPASLLDDETLELVIAGDFIDFLAIPEQASWTPDPYAARDKLVRTMTGSSVFAPVFAALARLVEAGHRITILIGNHDVELALPQVQDALLAQLGASRHQVLFVDDGRAYRIGRALIEHGNRYDGANVNDWTGLRVIASALSRGEEPPVALKVSAGSLIVENVINHIKPRYPFIDLLQPQGELVALLLVAFEPALAWQADKLARILQGKRLQGENLEGIQPGRTRNVAHLPINEEFDEELSEAFGKTYQQLRQTPTQVGLGDVLSIALAAREDSLAAILARGDSVPSKRLLQIQLAMRRLLLDDHSDRPDGPTEQYGAAASRLIEHSKGEIETVVMGHTHLARQLGEAKRANYINTGTWADVVRVPVGALEDEGTLEVFLRDLHTDRLRDSPRTYADLRVEADGRVMRATLERAAP